MQSFFYYFFLFIQRHSVSFILSLTGVISKAVVGRTDTITAVCSTKLRFWVLHTVNQTWIRSVHCSSMQILGAFDVVGYVMQTESHIHSSPMSICSPVDSVPGRQQEQQQLPLLGDLMRLLLQPQIAPIQTSKDLGAAVIHSSLIPSFLTSGFFHCNQTPNFCQHRN